MKEYVLNYYPNFKCIAEKCKHTCCAGWTINIDPLTLSSYKDQTNDFHNTLKNGMNFKKSTFKTDKTKRCAFLNNDNLCDIILNLGEPSLCQVCRDHPRFRNFFEDRTETGLGFCCEQATKIILSFPDKIETILINDDNNNKKQSFIEEQILKFRNNALNIIQDRNKSVNDRITQLLSLCDVDLSEKEIKKILKLFFSLERLDKKWTCRLHQLKSNQFTLNTPQTLALYCEQFLSNSFFRHLSNVEDVMLMKSRTLACIISWLLVKNIFEIENTSENDFQVICDIVRAYSSEVEYSQKNLSKLYAFTQKLAK